MRYGRRRRGGRGRFRSRRRSKVKRNVYVSRGGYRL